MGYTSLSCRTHPTRPCLNFDREEIGPSTAYGIEDTPYTRTVHLARSPGAALGRTVALRLTCLIEWLPRNLVHGVGQWHVDPILFLPR